MTRLDLVRAMLIIIALLHAYYMQRCLKLKCVLLVGLMGLFEKRRFRNFLVWANEYDEKNPKTHKGISCTCD